ncbi:RNA-binding protein [Aestuariibacter halophilus]|uniref:RNA-binding protein n=1 Tax=Fluctibacter halophilus TaxID=226011 RepID=A0ABS8G5K0_9ALTE|nr:RNA-binding protein [Aestuariibacter halophilus]MCC2615381.1 RNA-binding protein [Aestuariibacter halophilus]
MKLYIGNLSYRMTNDELNKTFSAYGDVLSTHIVLDRETQRSKGFAFVEFSDKQAAESAMQSLNGKELAGRTIVVNEARPKPARQRRAG